MKTFNIYKHSLVLAVAACVIIPNCSQSTDQDIAGGTTTTTTSTVAATATRECTPVMSGATSARLEDFLQPGEGVTNLEPPVTYCLTLSGSSSSFRLEFEADAGIFYTSFSQTLVAARTVSGSTTSIEIIFEDDFGLVGIKGSRATASTAPFQLTVTYYNFPSYAEAMQQALDQLRQECQSGQMTVAQCEGYSAPLPWWEDPAYDNGSTERLNKARSILADSSQSSVLGTVAFAN